MSGCSSVEFGSIPLIDNTSKAKMVLGFGYTEMSLLHRTEGVLVSQRDINIKIIIIVQCTIL